MDPSKNIWVDLAFSLSTNQLDYAFNLLEDWVKSENPTIWQWEILNDDFNLFPQASVNYLFQLTSGPKGVGMDGSIHEINPNIRTVASEVFNFIATVSGVEAVKSFERAFIALQNDPSLTYEFWFKYRLKLGFNSDLEDSIINAVNFQEVYAPEPIYLENGYANIEPLILAATLEAPVYKGASLKLYQRNYEKYKILQTQMRLKLGDSDEIFRTVGPVNRIVNADLTTNTNCSLYGGCRMFLCDCYDKEWFKGYCEICLRKISHPHFALRIPLLTGSWEGCFCSPGCVEYKIETRYSSLELYLFFLFWDKIKEKGIYRPEFVELIY